MAELAVSIIPLSQQKHIGDDASFVAVASGGNPPLVGCPIGDFFDNTGVGGDDFIADDFNQNITINGDKSILISYDNNSTEYEPSLNWQDIDKTIITGRLIYDRLTFNNIISFTSGGTTVTGNIDYHPSLGIRAYLLVNGILYSNYHVEWYNTELTYTWNVTWNGSDREIVSFTVSGGGVSETIVKDAIMSHRFGGVEIRFFSNTSEQITHTVEYVNFTGPGLLNPCTGETAEYTYQYKKNTIDIPNETNQSLEITNIQQSDFANYTVEVGDGTDTVLSNIAILSEAAPLIPVYATPQNGDVNLFQTPNDGEINVEGGIVEMNGGLETSAYLSMFGGNEDDDGSADNSKTYWGNLDETEPEKKYISKTQYLLKSIPATSGNLKRIEGAAKSDLAWFISSNVASSVDVVATIPGLNKIKLSITILANGEEKTFSFTENWRAL